MSPSIHRDLQERAGRVSFTLVTAITTLLIGGLLYPAIGLRPFAPTVWGLGLIISGTPLVLGTIRGILRGRFAADIVASLAVVTAAVMSEPLVGLIVVIMQLGGEALERRARRRAADATRALEEAAPRVAHRFTGDRVDDIPAADVIVGDLLLVRPGDLIPCDGVVVEGRSHLDTAAITGEPLPIAVVPGSRVRSGSANREGAITIEATAPASASEYETIVELVRTAHRHKAPLQRVADRYAVWFTPAVILLAALAYMLSGDADRVLAVLVVATPCPLILATPVALIGGINRAARRKVVMRHGGALEHLGTIELLVLDKTGTITLGRPQVSRVVTMPGVDEREMLRLAAAVEQVSSHVLARSTVAAARAQQIALPHPSNAHELAGRGVSGDVGTHRVTIGARSFVESLHPLSLTALDTLDGERGGVARAYVAIDNRGVGYVEYDDALRDDLHALREELEALGVERIMLLSGDTEKQTQAVAAAAGLSNARGDLTAADKAAIVQQFVKAGDRVGMVGDGTNDAPALATATVGIALAAHSGGVTAAAADVVILGDDLRLITEAMRISRRTMRIARQGIGIGLGLSAVGMLFAAAGLLPPLAGALLQEGIDLVVIVNALRAAR